MTNEELVKQYQEGNQEALDELVNNNGGIISKLAYKYLEIAKRRCLEFDDLFNSGVIGLIYAAKRYSFDNGAQFITLLCICIKQEMLSCINGKSGKDKGNMKLNSESLRLNAPVKDGEEIEFVDTVKCEEYGYDNTEDKILLNNLRRELEETMDQVLEPIERDIIKLAYGWDGKDSTYEEIGQSLNITFRKVLTLRAKAGRKLRCSKWVRTVGRKYKRELIGDRKTYYECLRDMMDYRY